MNAIKLFHGMAKDLKNGLIWLPDLGIGYHTQEPMSYEGEYFRKYQALDDSETGAALTKARCDLVNKFKETLTATCIDIGIGGGRFCRESGFLGYDVNSDAVEWLRKEGIYCDPYDRANGVHSLSFWDSLEHIQDPSEILGKIERYAFVSLPIFENCEHLLESKHYKPGEHIWYFTELGFIRFMGSFGFEVVECNHAETELGREGITSFVFEKKAGA